MGCSEKSALVKVRDVFIDTDGSLLEVALVEGGLVGCHRVVVVGTIVTEELGYGEMSVTDLVALPRAPMGPLLAHDEMMELPVLGRG
jgi:hypothetical protein